MDKWYIFPQEGLNFHFNLKFLHIRGVLSGTNMRHGLKCLRVRFVESFDKNINTSLNLIAMMVNMKRETEQKATLPVWLCSLRHLAKRPSDLWKDYFLTSVLIWLIRVCISIKRAQPPLCFFACALQDGQLGLIQNCNGHISFRRTNWKRSKWEVNLGTLDSASWRLKTKVMSGLLILSKLIIFWKI